MAKKKSQQDEGRTVYDVTPEEFIEAWQTSKDAQEVADKLKMPKPIVFARASKYRKQGINLKDHRSKRGRGIDVDKLNRLIEDIEARQKR